MRILAVANSLNRGGIEVQLLRAVPLLKAAGVKMDLCCMGPRGVLDEAFEALGCDITYLKKSWWPWRTANQLEVVLSHGNYDLVHSNFGYTAGGEVLAARRLGIPCIVSIHSSEPLSLVTWKRVPILRLARLAWLHLHRYLVGRFASAIVGVSRTNLTNFLAFGGSEPVGQTSTVSNGVEIPRHLPSRLVARSLLRIATTTPVLLHIGSFRPEKDHDGLYEILSLVLRKRPDAHLICVGDGALRIEAQRKVLRAGLNANVTFAGQVADVWPYFAAADAFVFPSITEGFGNALVESQVAGVRFVASDIPAHREVVPPDRLSQLYRKGDAPAAANLVLAHLNRPAELDQENIEGARAYVTERFSIKAFSDNWLKIYRDLTSEGTTARPRSSAVKPLRHERM